MFRGSCLALVAVLAVSRPALADEPSALQRASMFAKSSVVRVLGFWEVTIRFSGDQAKEYVGGMGSGFFVSADGFVVTNAHVVSEIHDGEEVAKQKAFASFLRKVARSNPEVGQLGEERKRELYERLSKQMLVKSNNQIVLSDGAKLDYTIKAFGKPGEGSDVAVIKVDIKDAPNLQLADSEKVQIQDRLLAIGYPGAADMQGTGLLDDKSQLEASINEGAISARKRTPNGETLFQTSAAITHGNSGGPAVNDRGEVIGLGTFGSTGEVQGFNFLVASSTVQKFLTQAKVDTTPSQTIKVWKKGLDELYAEELDAAIADFEEVMTLFQNHSEAPRLTKQARALKKEGKGKASSDGGSSAGAAVAIIVVVIVIVLVIVLVAKSKKKPGVAPGVPGMAPPPGYPPGMPPPGMVPTGPMMAGRSGPAPVAKTMAISPSGSHPPVAATAFGSMTMGSLTCVRGLLHGQRFSLGPQGLLIGRQPGLAQIVVNDSRASGKHVWIGYENGQLVAIDQNTTNGTFVNDPRNRISKVPLRDGDTVIVADPDCLSLQIRLGG
jgi:serine protease Do